MKNKMIFFTFRDFNREGGGSLRIKGMINAFAINNRDIVLYANAEKNKFNQKIKIIELKINFSNREKRILLFLLSYFHVNIVYYLFYKKMITIETYCKNQNLQKEQIVFCEYLDNAIGYYLQKRGCIGSCINDIHGMSVNEFKYKKSYSLKEKIINKLKYISAILLEKKVFNNVDGFIFASQTMQSYYIEKYPKIDNKKNIIIPYLLGDEAVKQIIDYRLKDNIIKQYNIQRDEIIIFFAGSFKDIGGVLDLIDSFIAIAKKVKNIKLFLIGEGENIDEIQKKIIENNLENKIILAGLIPYKELRTYQDIATLIVCPDRQNIFSNFIFHLKYLDSLMSGKIVINGNFKSILEVNSNEELSINFEPSNVESLTNKILYSINNLKTLNERYSGNIKYTKENFSYSKYIKNMVV